MYTRTLLQLRTSLLQLGGFEMSTDITPVVANQYLVDALEETYEFCVACADDFYTKISTPFSLVLNQDTYALPLDFYNLRKVELQRDVHRWYKLFPINIDGANRSTSIGSTYHPRYRYRVSTAGVTFDPVPQTTDVIRMYYVPLAPQPALDTDTVTFDRPVEQKLVLHVALRDIMLRSDLDTGGLDTAIERMKRSLRTAADSHDAGEPFYLDDHNSRGMDDDC